MVCRSTHLGGGKIGVPERVLHKAGALDAHEWEEVKSHPLRGVKIVEPVGFSPLVVAAIRSHHEHWNGRGYPDGLAGEAIPLMARIISVADAYDAITSERPFRSPGSGATAVAELCRGAGCQFDPGVVEAFLQLPGIALDGSPA